MPVRCPPPHRPAEDLGSTRPRRRINRGTTIAKAGERLYVAGMGAAAYYVDEESGQPAGVMVDASHAVGDPNWQVDATFVMYEGQPVLADLHLLPRLPPDVQADCWTTDFVPPDACLRGISARLLRSISLPELEREARQGLMALARRNSSTRWRRELERAEASFDRPGRGGRGDSDYVLWAVRYIEAVERGSRTPIADLAASHGLDKEQVRDRVHEARVRRLLTRAGRGKVGGHLTEKAEAIMQKGRKARGVDSQEPS